MPAAEARLFCDPLRHGYASLKPCPDTNQKGTAACRKVLGQPAGDGGLPSFARRRQSLCLIVIIPTPKFSQPAARLLLMPGSLPSDRLGSYRGTALAKRSRAGKGQVRIRLQPLRTAVLCCVAFLHGYPKATLFCRERCQWTAYFLRHNLNRQEAVSPAS